MSKETNKDKVQKTAKSASTEEELFQKTVSILERNKNAKFLQMIHMRAKNLERTLSK